MLKTESGSGAAARRARGRQEMQAAILDVAQRIVDEEGVDKLTIRGIAQEIGYSPGAIYEYFASKEAILNALYFHGANGLGTYCEQTIRALPEGTSATDMLLALGYGYRRYALAHEELYRLAFASFKQRPEAHDDHDDESRGGFGTLLRVAQRGIDEGEFVPDVPAAAIAAAAWSAVHGFVSLELTGHLGGVRTPDPPLVPPGEDQHQRDHDHNHLFDVVVHMMLYGFVRRERRPSPDAP